MRLNQRSAALVTSVAALSGLAIVAAPAASADADQCQTSGAGPSVCIGFDPKGYAAGVNVDIFDGEWDFNLVCDNGNWFGDEGAFEADQYSYHSYVFQVGGQGTCHVVAITGEGHIKFSSPNLTR